MKNEHQSLRPVSQQFGNRILRPIRARNDWPRQAELSLPVKRIAVLDCETTGLDVECDRIIEICVAIVLVDPSGQVVCIQSIGTGLEDPGNPLSQEIAELTGLTDNDLAGQWIERKRLAEFIGYCEGAIAFNAGFDRPFIEKLLPELAPLPWGCAMKDVPWRRLGFEPGPQNYLLTQASRYNPAAHRAQNDVLALVELLAHSCRDGETIISNVLSAMNAPAYRFEASTAAYGYRHELKRQGYRWAPEKSHELWHKAVKPADFRSEYRWYKQTIGKRPVIVLVPATERYRAIGTWLPKRAKVEMPAWRR